MLLLTDILDVWWVVPLVFLFGQCDFVQFILI